LIVINKNIYKGEKFITNMYRNKRGAGEDIWIIIAIVIGVLALVLIAVGFTTGWSNLWEKFNLFTGGKGSLSSAAEACTITCGKGEAGKTAWCGDTMDVKGLTLAQLQTLNLNIKDNAGKMQFGTVDLTSGNLIYIKDSNSQEVIPTDNAVAIGRTVTSPDKVRITVKAVSQSKQTADVSGITCSNLKEKNLIQVACDLSC